MPDPMDESELSELTEADEDGTPPDIRTSSSTARPVSISHADCPEGPPPRIRKAAAGAKRKSRSRNARKSANAASANSRRKKRGGIVPAPMWDWAYKGGTAQTPSSASASGSHPGQPTTTTPAALPATGTHANPSSSHNTITTTHSTTATRHSKSPSATPDAEEEEEEEEQPAPPRAMEEEEGEEGDPDGRGRGHREDEEDIQDEEDDPIDDQDVDEEDESVSPSSRPRQRPSPVSHQSTSNASRIRKPCTSKTDVKPSKVVNAGPDIVEADQMDVDDVDADDHAEGSATEEDYPDRRYSSVTRPPHARSNRPAVLAAVNHWDTHASPHDGISHELQVLTQDTVLSVPPSHAESPREHTPEEDDEPNGDTMGDAAEEQEGDGEAVDDEERSPTEPDDQLGDIPGEVDVDEHPNVQDDRESNIDDPELEVEEPDEDPDLQPAHRAEALDVLATIEIKFAMLRERVFLEKMEGIAWEESLIWEGAHPELHYIQEELTKRRDKRLMLAERKRRYEVQALERKRKEEEAGIWENWEHTRDQLQTEMMAETNRKRRKLERERRAAERPIPVRRFPVPIRDPPPAPSLREIVNATPLPSRLVQFISSANKRPLPDGAINPTLNSGLLLGYSGLGLNPTAYPDLPTASPADIAADLEYIFQHRRAGFGYPYGIFPGAPGVGFPAVGPGIGPGMGFGPGAGGAATGYNNAAGVPFGMNGLPTVETYPTSAGPGVTQPGPVPPPATGTSVPPSHNHAGMTGPGVGPTDSAGFGQPSMGTFQPSAGRESAYPPGPGGPSTSGRIPRSSGPPLDREWEAQAQRERERERELVAREHTRELAQQRDREIRERERVGEINSRGRDREFGPNVGPGYQSSGWNSKPSGPADWGLSERRREDDIMDREREKERVDWGDRDKSQAQPGLTPAPRPQNQQSHLHSHHTHLAPSPHLAHSSHSSHSSHQAHSQPPHAHPHHQHQHPHPHQHPHSPHPHLHTQHPHGPTGAAPHHHHVSQHHHRHHHHILHNHHSSGPESRIGPTSGVGVEGPGIRSGQGHQTPTMELINLSANPSSKTHWKREEGKYGGGSVPGSRPSSTHPSFPTYDERDRPVATSFVLGPSQNTASATSSPRHNWAHGEVGNSVPPGGPGAAFPPPERYHSPIPGGPGTSGMPHRSSNPPQAHHRRQSPNSLTVSPSRSGPPTSPTNANLSNPIAPPSSMNTSSPGPFALPRKSSPVLPPPSKLGMPPIVFSPRLTGPGVLPPTGPGVPGMLSGAAAGTGVGVMLSGPPSGPGVPPPSGPGMSPPLAILSSTSGPGIPLPNGPGIIPQSGPGIPPAAGPGDGPGVPPPPFTGSRTASPLISFARTGAPPGQKIVVEGV